MKVCKNVRCYCLRNEWAGGACAFTGVSLFVGAIWAAIALQGPVLAWVRENVLLHGLGLGLGILLGVLLIFGFLCLGFSDCSREDSVRHHAYRGRRNPVFPNALHWIESLGTNPRRRRSGAAVAPSE